MGERAAAMTRFAGSATGAPGLAAGPLFVIEEEAPTLQVKDEAPRAALERALELARAELAALLEASSDEDAAALLEFQIAMLEDDSLLEPAWQAIKADTGAQDAWRAAIDLQLAEYINAEDAYFRARSADLRDMGERVARCLSGRAQRQVPAGAIVVARDLAPSVFLETDWQGGGIALLEGSTRSHVAMLARARGVPLIIGLGKVSAASGATALLDGERCELVVEPDGRARAEFATRRAQIKAAAAAADDAAGKPLTPLRTGDGEPVKLLVNVADGRELERLDASRWDGIGLVRTELLLTTVADLDNEERQFAAYQAMVQWAKGRVVTIRTLDAGADKPIPGYTVEEGNSFLGTRGVRLSLAAPGPLFTQLRAIARAAALGPVRVMVPMVTLPSELEAVRQLFEVVLRQLEADQVAHARPQLGMMVEVPLAALSIDSFDSDFFSIGSNDLVQYLSAASRESGRLAALQDPLHPAVLSVIRGVVTAAARRNIDVSICGDMAAEPRCVAALLDAGLRSLSVAPAAGDAVRRAIAAFSRGASSRPVAEAATTQAAWASLQRESAGP